MAGQPNRVVAPEQEDEVHPAHTAWGASAGRPPLHHVLLLCRERARVSSFHLAPTDREALSVNQVASTKGFTFWKYGH